MVNYVFVMDIFLVREEQGDHHQNPSPSTSISSTLPLPFCAPSPPSPLPLRFNLFFVIHKTEPNGEIV